MHESGPGVRTWRSSAVGVQLLLPTGCQVPLPGWVVEAMPAPLDVDVVVAHWVGRVTQPETRLPTMPGKMVRTSRPRKAGSGPR